MSDDDEGRLLGFDQSDGVVKTVLDEKRLLGILAKQKVLAQVSNNIP